MDWVPVNAPPAGSEAIAVHEVALAEVHVKVTA